MQFARRTLKHPSNTAPPVADWRSVCRPVAEEIGRNKGKRGAGVDAPPYCMPSSFNTCTRAVINPKNIPADLRRCPISGPVKAHLDATPNVSNRYGKRFSERRF